MAVARIGWNELLNYWRSLADGGEPPARDRFDPVVVVPRAVAHLTLFGVEPAGFRIRLVGSELGGWNLAAGRLLADSALDLPIRDAIEDALRSAACARVPVLAHYLAHYDEPVRWTTLYLPLSDGCGTVCAVVAGTFHERGHPHGALRVFQVEPDDATATH